jgi:hypothetical protein
MVSWELHIVSLAEQNLEGEFIYRTRLREGEQ